MGLNGVLAFVPTAIAIGLPLPSLRVANFATSETCVC
jgi:hypothetical protein